MDVYVIAGPNGSGKTTIAGGLLPEILNCEEYINADAIAKSLSPFHPESVAFQAGKLAIERISYLSNRKVSFTFESTLASKTLLRHLQNCKQLGYTINIIYLWLRTADLAVKRVQDRVNNGGHNIPKEIVIRRYARSIENFKNIYLPIANNWFLYDNSGDRPLLVARQQGGARDILSSSIWNTLITE